MNKQEKLSPKIRTLYASTPLNNKGFTLIEIFIVVVLMGILAAFTVPDLLKWRPNLSVKNAANDLRANMQRARLTAIKRNENVAIVFDTTDAADGAYTLCTSPGADTFWTTLADNDIIETVRLSNYNFGIIFGQGEATTAAPGDAFPADGSFVSYPNDGTAVKAIVFDPRGTCDAGFAYLEHEDNTTSYAIGTQASGVIMVKRWKGGSYQ